MPSDLMPEYDAYEFAISNTNNRKSPRDYKLRQTILSLIYEFFRQRNAVMLYLCETGDNRQKYRSRLFESWFRSSGYQKTFVLMTTELPDEYGIWNYVALILRPDHPQFVSIAQQFSDNSATRLLCFVINPNNLISPQYPQLTRHPASLNRIAHLKFFQYLLPVAVKIYPQHPLYGNCGYKPLFNGYHSM